MRPFFPFYGSKWNIARHYPAPFGDVVVEPFAGGAGYSTYHGVTYALLVDADPIIAGLWKYLINVSAEEIAALPLLPNAGDNVDDYDIPQEAKWLIGFWLNRGSATPKKSRTAYSTRTDRGQLNWSERAKDRIIQQLPGIRNWDVYEGDFAIAERGEQPATWFIDPPYGEKGRYYRVGFQDYERLAEHARELASNGEQVIVCEGVGATWLPFEPLGEFKTSGGKSLEVVWTS